MSYPNRTYADQSGSYCVPPAGQMMDRPAMDPYTIQITNHLGESEKQLTEILSRVYQLNDKLFGPSPILGKSDPMFNNEKVPVPKAMMEQIVGQTNVLNRRLDELSEALNRLESL